MKTVTTVIGFVILMSTTFIYQKETIKPYVDRTKSAMFNRMMLQSTSPKPQRMQVDKKRSTVAAIREKKRKGVEVPEFAKNFSSHDYVSYAAMRTPLFNESKAVNNMFLAMNHMCQRFSHALDHASNRMIQVRKQNTWEALQEINSQPFTPRNVVKKIQIWEGEDKYNAKTGAWQSVADAGEDFEKLKGKPMILCTSYTYSKNHRNAKSIYNIWGRKCDHHLLFTNASSIEGVPNSSVVEIHPEGGEGYMNMWHKVRAMITYVEAWPRFHEFDFILFGGDDLFVFTENLRKLLLEPEIYNLHKFGVPLHLGHRFFINATQRPFNSGAGYILNNVALRLLTALLPTCLEKFHTFAEDVNVAYCLSSHGIMPRDTADEFNEDRFIPFDPPAIVFHASIKSDWWYPQYRIRPMVRGFEGVSRYPVLFHYMTPKKSEQLYNDTYGVRSAARRSLRGL